MTRIPTIDLFAGAGGLSIGAARAGCDVRLLVEFDRVASETLRRNSAHHPGEVLEADVSLLHGLDLRERISLRKSEPLLVIGGPPCQPFSKAAFWSEDGDDAAYRRARASGNKASPPGTHGPRPDERRFLVHDFFARLIEADADGFVFENVASLMAPRNRSMLDHLVDSTEQSGFKATVVRANAVEFGLPQRRERVFVLASKRARPIAPTPTHRLEARRTEDLVVLRRAPAVTCGPVLAPYANREFFEPEEVVSGKWAKHLRTVPPGWNYKAHTAWGGHPKPTFVTETRFWNFLLKLSPELPSWTVPANPGPWTGPFHWESRRLRTPELAALQGFPHGYCFVGSRRERVRQIGNAAPPPLAEQMIRAVIHAMTGEQDGEVDRDAVSCAA